MSDNRPIPIMRIAAPLALAALLGGCIVTAGGGARYGGPPYGPAYGHHSDFMEFHGPIFGYSGSFTFVYDHPDYFRIVGHDGIILGFAIVEFGYRLRIIDVHGATLYWCYREPDGLFHLIGPGHQHLGYIDHRHRHFPAFNRFTERHVRVMQHREIEADRQKLPKPEKQKKKRGR